MSEKKWSEEDLIYLAGFLDGEGCFWIYKNRIGITCANTYKPVIDWMKELFGGSLSRSEGKKANHRPVYNWQLVGHNCKELISYIVPYLKEKQKQALLLYSFQSLPTCQGSRTGIPKEIQEERDRLVEIFKGTRRVTY